MGIKKRTSALMEIAEKKHFIQECKSLQAKGLVTKEKAIKWKNGIDLYIKRNKGI